MREYTQVGVVDVEVARAMPDDDQIVAVEANAVGPDGKTQTYATRETFLDQVEQRLVADGGRDE
jgi:hypothetical protein